MENDTFGRAVKRRERVAIARGGDHADEAPGAEFVRYVVQLSQQAGVVGFVIGVARMFGSVVLVRCIPGRTHARRAFEGVDFKSGVVGDDDLALSALAVVLGL